MTQDQIIEWARAVDAHRYTNRHFPDQPAFAFDIERLTRFANLVSQHQRKQDAMVKAGCGYNWDEIAAAIRSQE